MSRRDDLIKSMADKIAGDDIEKAFGGTGDKGMFMRGTLSHAGSPQGQDGFAKIANAHHNAVQGGTGWDTAVNNGYNAAHEEFAGHIMKLSNMPHKEGFAAGAKYLSRMASNATDPGKALGFHVLHSAWHQHMKPKE